MEKSTFNVRTWAQCSSGTESKNERRALDPRKCTSYKAIQVRSLKYESKKNKLTLYSEGIDNA